MKENIFLKKFNTIHSHCYISFDICTIHIKNQKSYPLVKQININKGLLSSNKSTNLNINNIILIYLFKSMYRRST